MEQMNPSRLTAGKFSNNAAPPLLRNVVGSYFRSTCLLLVFWLFAHAELAFGQNTQTQSGAVAVASAASEAITLYRNLRTVGLDSSKIYKIRDAEFDLEDMHFSLKEGTIAFLQPIAGHVTGAMFAGEGEVLLVPPDQGERASLALFTKSAVLEENFQSAYIRFFDDQLVKDLEAYLRPPDDANAFATQWGPIVKNLAESDALRLLTLFTNQAQDGRGPEFLHARVSGRQRGTFDLIFDSEAPEQINAGQVSYTASGAFYDSWLSFVMRSKRQREKAERQSKEDPVVIPNLSIKVGVHPPDSLDAVAEVTLLPKQPGLRTLVLELSRYLKVSSITVAGKPLDFIQNEALAGTELARRGNDVVAVIFPEALPHGKNVQLTFTYAGSVLSDAGGGLLRVGARGTWYPSFGLQMSDFELEFRCPQEWTLLATGKQQSVRNGNGEQVSRWKTERPIPVAGFNLGHYVQERAQSGASVVESYASRSVENSFPVRSEIIPQPNLPIWNGRQPQHRMNVAPPVPSTPTPSNLALKVARNSAKTIDYLSSKIGPFPYSSLALTQMPGNYSQGWPGLVFLSSYVFVPEQQRPKLPDEEFGRILFNDLMLAHETAHQWWGDAVLWAGYRDQWISEALANYCAMMSLEAEHPAEFRAILTFYRKQLTAKNMHGEERGQAGPVTLGQRLVSSHFPQGYEDIAYGRGTWLIHMMREMLRDSARKETSVVRASRQRVRPGEASDDLFFSVLRNIQTRFAGKQLSTDALKQAFEEVLPKDFQFEGHKSLDWFFEGWVKGTAMPTYALEDVKISLRTGKPVAAGTLLQKNAPNSLITAVPIYASLPDGTLRFLARVFADGDETTFKLPVPAGTKKLVIDPEQTLLTHP
jgi:hypothetical protein